MYVCGQSRAGVITVDDIIRHLCTCMPLIIHTRGIIPGTIAWYVTFRKALLILFILIIPRYQSYQYIRDDGGSPRPIYIDLSIGLNHTDRHTTHSRATASGLSCFVHNTPATAANKSIISLLTWYIIPLYVPAGTCFKDAVR